MPTDAEEEPIRSRLTALSLLLPESEYSVVEKSLKALLDRLLIGRILTDPAFVPVLELPDVYLSKLSELIDGFVANNNLDEIVSHRQRGIIRAIILRGQAYKSRNALVADSTFFSLLQNLLQMQQTEVRCQCCGYHFRYSDVDGRRAAMIGSLEITLSSSMHPDRVVDPVKRPIMTKLEVDHIVPRAGWGGTEVSNLQILCQLCNQGKSIYTAGLEALSVIAAGSYSLNSSIEYYPNRTIFYAALNEAGSKCQRCDADASMAELTVAPTSEWFTPWTAVVTCYACV